MPLPLARQLAGGHLGQATFDNAVNVLFNQARRYQFASEQDANPMVAATHNGYAVALADSLAEIATEEDVHRITGYSLMELRERVKDQQRKIEAEVMDVVAQLEALGIDMPGLHGHDGVPAISTAEGVGFVVGGMTAAVGFLMGIPVVQYLGAGIFGCGVFSAIARNL